MRTCNDAHVLLSETWREFEQAYEVVWGSNSNSLSQIRKSYQGAPLQETYVLRSFCKKMCLRHLLVCVSRATAEICDCERFTEFWVSWSELTNIAQGTGSVVTSHTINYVEDTSDPVDIHLVSLASWTTASAEWVLHESQSKLDLLPVL